MLDAESAEWHNDKELFISVDNFHKTYAMPPEKLESVKLFHENVLNKFFKYLGCCTDIKKIGGSYEGVKIVKSEEEDDFEFDVMFVLKIPEECHLEIMEIPGRHGYAMLTVSDGYRGTPDYYRAATDHKFFAGCLTFENDTLIVDAGKTIAAFFGKLRKWMNTKPVAGYHLRPKQHGTAIQMDVLHDDSNTIFYSVDIAPTLEIWEGGCMKRYVVKPEKKRSQDSITWRRLFDFEESASGLEQLAINTLRSAVDELEKQLSEYCANCKGVCQGSCFIHEALRAQTPLPEEYLLKLQEALVVRESNYRLTFVNLQELNISKNKRIPAINYFFENELEVIPAPEKPGYAWLKLHETDSSSSRFNSALKLCYLPGGKYLDIKAASDMLVEELQDITKDVFDNDDSVVRRDGPIVRIEVNPEKGNTMLYYSLEIVLAVYVDRHFYIGLPSDYDVVPDRMAWRRSYSYEETTKIQQAPEGLKTIFRVLKALRTGECGLAQLTSYHFKTILLNMQRLKTVNWNETIGKLLMVVLRYLKICLSVKKLQTHFIPEINLLENMTNDCSVNMKNRIDELLRSKRKMFKALKVSTEETTEDILMEHDIEFVDVLPQSMSLSVEAPERNLMADIETELFGYDYRAMTSKPVYKDIVTFRIFPNEDEFLTNFRAVMFISDNKSNLRACRNNPRVVRLKRCNPTGCISLLQTVSHNSGLADTRKTAEYIKQQMEKIIKKSSFLAGVRVHLEECHIVLKALCCLKLTILPGYQVGEDFFAAMPGVSDTSAWIRIPFTPVRNKFWKAFTINECGKRVLSKLKEILYLKDSSEGLTSLSEYHLRMALFWEMEVEQDWSDDKEAERVHDVLDRLMTSIKQNYLPNYFYSTTNTLSQF